MKYLIKLVILVVLGSAPVAHSWAQTENHKRKPNHLLGAQSPYLQQHIYNAVDWYPWGKEALEKAQRENKPIFLSVGYSTCHWCHVMSRESFDDDTIGQFLNDNYVAIKIDRERRPDLDEQFMLATQALTGRGGWPNSVFLTSDAKPYYAATYLPPEEFLNVLQQIARLWREDRVTLEAEGERISTGIMGFMNRTEAAQQLTDPAMKKAADEIIKQFDYFSGGLGSAPKFPQETAFLFLLDRAQRGDQEALDIVKAALDGMLKGGIHDHVGGGFHRYAVDPHWRVPHFEKMLYNQAMIGRLLIRTYELSGEYRYKHTAIRLLDYVLREMQSPLGGFYSAQDADSYSETGSKEEGVFYVWSKKEIDELAHPDFDALKQVFPVSEKGNFEGHNILHLTSRIDELAKETGTQEKVLYENIDKGLNRLRLIREANRRAPHKDEKIIVSWNAMMIETLAEAAFVLDRPDYWRAARSAANYINNNMLQDDGLKRISFEGSIGVDGQLADYAGLGVALLALQKHTPVEETAPDNRDVLKRLIADIREKFTDPVDFEGKPLLMTGNAEGMGNFAPLDDNPIPSGNSLALKLYSQLAARDGDLELKKRTLVLTSTLSGYALASAQSRGTLVNSAYGVQTSQVGSIRHVANGNVRVSFKLDRNRQMMKLMIRMKEGWHINSNQPLEEYFIPTVLSVGGAPVEIKTYPQPLEKKLRFNGKKLSLYEDELTLQYPIADGDVKNKQVVGLDIQACSDEICLEPETLSFNFWTN